MLVTDKVYRTYKFLSALARGAHIVSEAWLQACAHKRRFVDVAAFGLRDDVSEKRFKFALSESVRAARERPVFDGYSVYVTPSTKPLPAELDGKCGFFVVAGFEYRISDW